MRNKSMICYLSEIGHGNFYYPTDIKAVLNDLCECEPMNYLGGSSRNLKAVKVKSSCLVPLELNDSFVNKNLNSYSIVWVKI
jgi:hypothetical protein|tara:strand:+ start:536 stop:781 length:246 start_codon:yes stop_codon:yes gene_type:complete